MRLRRMLLGTGQCHPDVIEELRLNRPVHVLELREPRLRRQLGDEIPEPPEREPRTAMLVWSPPVAVVNVVELLEVGLHLRRMFTA